MLEYYVSPTLLIQYAACVYVVIVNDKRKQRNEQRKKRNRCSADMKWTWFECVTYDMDINECKKIIKLETSSMGVKCWNDLGGRTIDAHASPYARTNMVMMVSLHMRKSGRKSIYLPKNSPNNDFRQFKSSDSDSGSCFFLFVTIVIIIIIIVVVYRWQYFGTWFVCQQINPSKNFTKFLSTDDRIVCVGTDGNFMGRFRFIFVTSLITIAQSDSILHHLHRDEMECTYGRIAYRRTVIVCMCAYIKSIYKVVIDIARTHTQSPTNRTVCHRRVYIFCFCRYWLVLWRVYVCE